MIAMKTMLLYVGEVEFSLKFLATVEIELFNANRALNKSSHVKS